MPPSKRAGSGATKSQKKKKKPAQRIDSSDDEMEEATTGPKITKQPCFGAQYMLFRVMMLGGKAVSFSRSEGNWQKRLSEAAKAGAKWARCGTDGRDGLMCHHFADSRVHRLGREVGFARADQAKIDGDQRSRQVYAEFRHEVNQIKSHVQRVKNQALFERRRAERAVSGCGHYP